MVREAKRLGLPVTCEVTPHHFALADSHIHAYDSNYKMKPPIRGDRDMERAYFDQFKMALDPEDIARSIMFALEQPRHVQVAQMVVLPVNRW